MNQHNIMKLALAEQWSMLPATLQAHYQDNDNVDTGTLDIEYPGWMQAFLNVLYLFGALLNKKGCDIPSRVEKTMQGDEQYWRRTITLQEGKQARFNSRWVYAGKNRLIEYVNTFIGLCMSVQVKDNRLYYQGEYFVIRLAGLTIPVPEWLLLGHTTIVEQQVDAKHFSMDFRLTHPLFGEIYRYSGKFSTLPRQ